ncbi:unnamed protein product, partial [Polarella glacialis]
APRTSSSSEVQSDVPSAGDASCGVRAQIAELRARQSGLEAQLLELDAAQQTEHEKAAQSARRVETLQREMAAAVDEHGAFSRGLLEARARASELARESHRLQSTIKEAASEEEAVRRQDEERLAVGRQPERYAEKSAQRLALHREYLLRLEAWSQVGFEAPVLG